MIFSMTGYAIKSQEMFKETVTIEVRSLNSKFFDFSLKCSESFFCLEEQVKKITKKTLKRGKIEVKIKKYSESIIKDGVNLHDLKQKMIQLKRISPKSNREKLLKLALLLPKTNPKKTEKLTKKYQKSFLIFFREVINQVIDFRTQEGKALYKELTKYINQITIQLEKIKKRDKKRIKNKKQKLKNQFDSMSQKYDKSRLEQEMIYYIDKLDISEEIIRLKHHKDYFLELLSSQNEVGKKINFLIQEMLRETNTIGSKSGDFELQKSVVLIKEELEKIKEQIQNVL